MTSILIHAAKSTRRPALLAVAALASLGVTALWISCARESASTAPTVQVLELEPAKASAATSSSPAWSAEWAALREIEHRMIEVARRVRPATVCLVFEEDEGRRRGTGSGVIVDHDGIEALVMTCGHVAKERGRHARVVLPDGRIFDGEVVASIQQDGIDLGLLRFTSQGEEIPFVPLAANLPETGDWVVALGHPRGLWIGDSDPDASDLGSLPPRWRIDSAAPSRARDRATLASAVRPPIVRSGRIWSEPSAGAGIRFDAPIEAGDSGGPVVDLDGRVVGISSRCGWKSFWNWASSVAALEGDPRRLMDDSIRWPEGPRNLGSGAGDSAPPSRSRFGEEYRSSLRSALTDAASRSVAAVHSDGGLRGYALCVGPGGLFVTKGSEVGFDGEVMLEALGRRSEAVRQAYDPDSDLLLLRAAKLDLTPVARPRRDDGLAVLDSLEPGTQLLSVGIEGDILSLGTLSLERSSWEEVDARPFLGISSRVEPGAGARVASVTAGAAAARAGVRAGDLIRSVDGVEVTRERPMPTIIADRSVGDRVRLRVDRDGRELEIDVTLERRPPSLRQRDRGNTRSATSAALPYRTAVLHHDGVVEPHECGAPLVDLDGRVVGINAARFDRTATIAIPIDEVMRRVRAMLDREPMSAERFMALAKSAFTATEQDGRVRLHAIDARLLGERSIRRSIGGVLAPDGSGMAIMADDIAAWDFLIDSPGRFEVTFFGSVRDAREVRLSIDGVAFDAPVPEGRSRRGASLGVVELGRPGRVRLTFEWVGGSSSIPGNLDRLELRRLGRESPQGESARES